MSAAGIDAYLEEVRRHLPRVDPSAAEAIVASGGLLVDTRPSELRRRDGEIPGALIIDRNVLEWRLAPHGSHRLPEATGFDRQVVVVCSEGYASSLAAASLHALGYRRAGDLIGGYQAWLAWSRDPSGRA